MGESDYSENFEQLCYYIGLALVTWQRVEGLHFCIFARFLGVPLSQITSAVYHSTETFAARNTMLNNMAHYFFSPIESLLPRAKIRQYKALQIEWQALHKRMKDAGLERNKLAHYTADFDLKNMRTDDEGNVVFDVTPHTLRPSSRDFVSRLRGHTPDKKEHNLGVEELKQLVTEFTEVAMAMGAFHVHLGQLPNPHTPIEAPPS